MSFDRFGIFPANIGGLVLRDLTDQGIRTASKKSIVIPGGSITPGAIATCCADPMLSVTTRDLATLFGPLSLASGYPVTPSGTPATFQFQKRDDGGAFKGNVDSEHTVAVSTKGFLFLESLMAQQDDEQGVMASLNYVFMSEDGLTTPIAFSNQSNLASSPTFQGIWYLGKVRIGQIGSSLTDFAGTTKVEIRTGLEFRSPRADGSVFPTVGSIHQVINEVRITTLDLRARNFLLSTPFAHGYTSTGAFNIYFQKGAHGGARVAASSAEHIVCTATTGDDTVEQISVQAINDVQMECIVRPLGNFSITTGVAIG